ncbi:MAG: hypothetical protein OEX02_19530, partial [Cyclobacteriaceae bacterium]|nr:hypothetical protein [Cyclobacteriaceae bacterium]
LKVRKTNLGFYKDQLNYIDFYYRKPDNLAFQSLLGQLEEDFGPAEQFNTIDEKGVLEAYRWKSKRVYLQLVRYGEGASDSDDKNMTVLMMELMK